MHKYVSYKNHDKLTTQPSQIPKPNEAEGLGVRWPQQKLEMDELKALAEQIKSKM